MAGPWYVDFDDGSDSNTGLSEAQAWKTIGKLSGSIISNSWVYVRSGLTTVEAPILGGFSGVKIRSVDFGIGSTDLSDTNFTITHPTGNARFSILAHQAENRTTVLQGVTIDAQGTVKRCLAGAPSGNFYGALQMYRCSLINATEYGVLSQAFGSVLGVDVINCTIHDIGIRGIAALCGGSANNRILCEDSVFYNCNQALYSANGGGAPKITRTLIYDCTAGLYLDGKAVTDFPEVDQCTIDSCVLGINSSPSDSSTSYITNTTISNCTFAVDSEGSGKIDLTYCNTYEAPFPGKATITTGSSSNIEVDPRFVDYLNADYHLTANSQLIGAGDPSTPAPTAGGRTPIDIGAYQYDIMEAFMSYDWSTQKLVYTLQLRLGDLNGDAFTDQVCLVLLNHAVDWYFSTYPDEAVNCGLIETDYTVAMTAGIGSLSADILMVKGARQADEPFRDARVEPITKYKRDKSSRVTRGTYFYPLVGVDLNARKIHLDADNYSSDLLVDYVRKPMLLKLTGVNDENGVAYTSTVDPEWPSQFALPILQKAIELGVQVYNRDTTQGDADKQALEILRRMST